MGERNEIRAIALVRLIIFALVGAFAMLNYRNLFSDNVFPLQPPEIFDAPSGYRSFNSSALESPPSISQQPHSHRPLDGAGSKDSGTPAGNTTKTPRRRRTSDWAILMVSINETYGNLSTSYTRAYAQVHGYDFHVQTDYDPEVLVDTRKRYWQKLLLIRKALEEDGYPFVYYKDTDVIITDCGRSLDDLFRSAEESKQYPQHGQQQASGGNGTATLDLLVTGDAWGLLCTGSLWIRNTEWARWLVRRTLQVLESGKASKPSNWYDQAALQYVLLGEPKKCSEDVMPCMPEDLPGTCTKGGYDKCESLLAREHRPHVAIGNAEKLSAFVDTGSSTTTSGQDDVVFSVHAGGLPADEKQSVLHRYSLSSTCVKPTLLKIFHSPLRRNKHRPA